MSQAEGGTISPDVINKLIKSIEKALSSGKFKGVQPIILCSSNVRKYLRRIVERISSSIVVLSSSEIVSTTNLDIRGMLKYES
jgi:flagellar biosynthesis protein FlhA